jgi:hypothetical protein
VGLLEGYKEVGTGASAEGRRALVQVALAAVGVGEALRYKDEVHDALPVLRGKRPDACFQDVHLMVGKAVQGEEAFELCGIHGVLGCVPIYIFQFCVGM